VEVRSCPRTACWLLQQSELGSIASLEQETVPADAAIIDGVLRIQT
jgi:hypothetical protein